MNGIEKITARIAADADAENAQLRRASDMRCAEIRAEYDKRAQEEYDRLLREGLAENERRASRIARAAGLEARKCLLALKQELVSDAFCLARRRIAGLPERDYVGFLARQAGAAAFTGEEELILNASDRARVGGKVVRAANAEAAKRGLEPHLTLSEETREIAGGLILKQGDIEVNCTVDTLLELSRGELAAQVAEVLFEG